MTTLPQSNGQESPEERQAKVERLLHEAAAWEPQAPATDFVARAMAREARKSPVKPERRQNRWYRAWWGFSTVGVVTASMLFTVTGKMPMLETDPRQKVTIEEPQYTPEPTPSATPKVVPQVVTQETVAKETSAKSAMSLLSVPMTRPLPSPVRRANPRRIASHTFRRRAERTSVPQTVTAPTPKVAGTPKKNDLPPVDTTQGNVTATPTSEVFTTEDGRMFVPMVLAHTSEDGTEVSYTPAVVEVAYRN